MSRSWSTLCDCALMVRYAICVNYCRFFGISAFYYARFTTDAH